jgi:hypothetical protein
MVLVIYAAMAAAGLVLLVARRLTGHRTTGRDRLSPRHRTGTIVLRPACTIGRMPVSAELLDRSRRAYAG